MKNNQLLSLAIHVPSTMPKHKYVENSEEWKELLHDFLNFEESGFKPFEQNIGGVDHIRSHDDFWEKTVGSKHTFRSLAKRVAMKACAFLPNSTLEKYGYDRTLDKVTDEGQKWQAITRQEG